MDLYQKGLSISPAQAGPDLLLHSATWRAPSGNHTSFLLKFYLFIAREGAHTTRCLWSSEDNLHESVHHEGSGIKFRSLGLATSALSLSHFLGLQPYYFNLMLEIHL